MEQSFPLPPRSVLCIPLPDRCVPGLRGEPQDSSLERVLLWGHPKEFVFRRGWGVRVLVLRETRSLCSAPLAK